MQTVLPFTRVRSVTTSDTEDNTCSAFMVGVAGNVALRTADGDDATLPVVAGTIYPIACSLIKATNTTATGIFALD